MNPDDDDVSPGCVVSLFLFPQFAPHNLLPAVQADGCRMRLHPPRLQVVQLGDPCVHRRETLVGVRGPHRNATAARW